MGSAVAGACEGTYQFLSAYPQSPLGTFFCERVAQNSELLARMRAQEIACHGHRAAWTDMCMSHTKKPLKSTNQTLLRILPSEKAMRFAVAEPAPPIMAMAISSTMECVNASDLPLW